MALEWRHLLVRLAWDGWRGETETSPSNAAAKPSDATYFLRGLVTNLLNPKAGIFYVAILPTFFDPSLSTFRQGVILSVIYVAIATTVHTVIVSLADTAKPWLADRERSQTTRRVLSGFLVAIAAWLLFATRHGNIG